MVNVILRALFKTSNIKRYDKPIESYDDSA